MAIVLSPTHTELVERRRSVLGRSRLSEDDLRLRAVGHNLSMDEYVILRELEEIDFLLGDDAGGDELDDEI